MNLQPGFVPMFRPVAVPLVRVAVPLHPGMHHPPPPPPGQAHFFPGMPGAPIGPPPAPPPSQHSPSPTAHGLPPGLLSMGVGQSGMTGGQLATSGSMATSPSMQQTSSTPLMSMSIGLLGQAPHMVSSSLQPTLQSLQGQTSLHGLQGQASLQGLQGQASIHGLQGQASLQGLQSQASLQGLQGQASLQGLQIQGQASLQGLQVQGHASLQGLQGQASLQGLHPGMPLAPPSVPPPTPGQLMATQSAVLFPGMKSFAEETARNSRGLSQYGEADMDMSEDVDTDDGLAVLSSFNSDLNLELDDDGYGGKAKTQPTGFCFCWAGAKSTHGAMSGKVYYEVHISEHLAVDFGEDHQETDPHVVRVGWSVDGASMQLGEEPWSYGYGGTGKLSVNMKFSNYGERFVAGDVIGALLDLESRPATVSYSKNGKWLGVAAPIHGFPVGQPNMALFPHILTKNCGFKVNFGQNSPWYPPPQGFVYVNQLAAQHKVAGMKGPAHKGDCEMIMIIGLPGAGKTTWGINMQKGCPDKRYNIIGTDTLIDKMRVMGLPRRRNYHGRWDVLIDKATKCLNSLFQIASKRNRNYILDQTNVYPSAQRRKMGYFNGFCRKAAVLVPEDKELIRRSIKRTEEDGKFVPEEAVLEMKKNFQLPDSSSSLFDEIMFVELPREISIGLVQQYNKEGSDKLPAKGNKRTFDRFSSNKPFQRSDQSPSPQHQQYGGQGGRGMGQQPGNYQNWSNQQPGMERDQFSRPPPPPPPPPGGGRPEDWQWEMGRKRARNDQAGGGSSSALDFIKQEYAEEEAAAAESHAAMNQWAKVKDEPKFNWGQFAAPPPPPPEVGLGQQQQQRFQHTSTFVEQRRDAPPPLGRNDGGDSSMNPYGSQQDFSSGSFGGKMEGSFDHTQDSSFGGQSRDNQSRDNSGDRSFRGRSDESGFGKNRREEGGFGRDRRDSRRDEGGFGGRRDEGNFGSNRREDRDFGNNRREERDGGGNNRRNERDGSNKREDRDFSNNRRDDRGDSGNRGRGDNRREDRDFGINRRNERDIGNNRRGDRDFGGNKREDRDSSNNRRGEDREFGGGRRNERDFGGNNRRGERESGGSWRTPSDNKSFGSNPPQEEHKPFQPEYYNETSNTDTDPKPLPLLPMGQHGNADSIQPASFGDLQVPSGPSNLTPDSNTSQQTTSSYQSNNRRNFDSQESSTAAPAPSLGRTRQRKSKWDVPSESSEPADSTTQPSAAQIFDISSTQQDESAAGQVNVFSQEGVSAPDEGRGDTGAGRGAPDTGSQWPPKPQPLLQMEFNKNIQSKFEPFSSDSPGGDSDTANNEGPGTFPMGSGPNSQFGKWDSNPDTGNDGDDFNEQNDFTFDNENAEPKQMMSGGRGRGMMGFGRPPSRPPRFGGRNPGGNPPRFGPPRGGGPRNFGPRGPQPFGGPRGGWNGPRPMGFGGRGDGGPRNFPPRFGGPRMGGPRFQRMPGQQRWPRP